MEMKSKKNMTTETGYDSIEVCISFFICNANGRVQNKEYQGIKKRFPVEEGTLFR